MATCVELTNDSCEQSTAVNDIDNAATNNSNNMSEISELHNDDGEVIYSRTSEEVNGEQSCSVDSALVELQTEVRSKLEQLKERIDDMTEIPDILLDVPLKCLGMGTLQYLSYHLDTELDIVTDNFKLKDYRGLAELIGLEGIFIRYVAKANYGMFKTSEIISKWLTRTEEPLPTLGNLQKYLKEMDRFDVLEDMSVKMAKDAVKWKLTELEARAANPKRKSGDTSWQLTRHDVVTGKKTSYTCCLLFSDEDYSVARMIIKLFTSVYQDALFFVPQFDLKTGTVATKATVDVIEERCSGRVIFIISEYLFASTLNQFVVEYCRNMDIVVTGEKTMYTACLLYANEDELMAQLFIEVFKEAYKDAKFFNPNFDLKAGKFELDTTATVISERCDNKVVFLLSEYFYASEICQFAVNYAAAHGTGNGNLIPFHLTRNIKDIPNVLTGITGIRWFRKSTRKHAWTCLAECLLAEKISSEDFAEVRENIAKLVERNKERYFQDPPYDDDVEPPGIPFPVVEPEIAFPMPTKEDIEKQRLQEEQELLAKRKSEKWKFLKKVRQKIVEKVFGIPHPFQSSPSPSVEMKPVGNPTNKASPLTNGFVDTKKNTNANNVNKNVPATNKDVKNTKPDDKISTDKSVDAHSEKLTASKAKQVTDSTVENGPNDSIPHEDNSFELDPLIKK